MPEETTMATFDFRGVSRLWGKSWRNVSTELMRKTLIAGATAKPDITAEELQTVQLAQLDAIEAIDELETTRDRLIAQVLVHVPATWLGDDAPEGPLDWKNADNLQYLQEHRFIQLIHCLNEARANPKN